MTIDCGLRRPYHSWADAEDALILDSSLSLGEVAACLGVPRSSVANRARLLRGHRFDVPVRRHRPQLHHWTDAEEALLLDPDLSLRNIAERLGLTLASVKSRATRLRKGGFDVPLREPDRLWRDSGDALIFDPDLSYDDVAERLGVPFGAVRNRAYRLRRDGLDVPYRRSRNWTETDALILDSSLSLGEVAARLGVPRKAVGYRVSALRRAGCEVPARLPGRRSRDWADGEDALILDRSLSYKEIADRLDVGRSSVKRRAHVLRRAGLDVPARGGNAWGTSWTFGGANTARTVAAGQRDAADAQHALQQSLHDPATTMVLQLRAAHPNLPLSELAAMAGITKDAYVGRLRRALAAAT